MDNNKKDKSIKVDLEDLYMIINNCRGLYPEDIFIHPVKGKLSCPDAYAAAGARLACDRILYNIEEFLLRGKR